MMTTNKKVELLPRQVAIMYDEQSKLMEWVLENLERRIWMCTRGEKIYKKG
jgi:hypothetical protein